MSTELATDLIGTRVNITKGPYSDHSGTIRAVYVTGGSLAFLVQLDDHRFVDGCYAGMLEWSP